MSRHETLCQVGATGSCASGQSERADASAVNRARYLLRELGALERNPASAPARYRLGKGQRTCARSSDFRAPLNRNTQSLGARYDNRDEVSRTHDSAARSEFRRGEKHTQLIPNGGRGLSLSERETTTRAVVERAERADMRRGALALPAFWWALLRRFPQWLPPCALPVRGPVPFSPLLVWAFLPSTRATVQIFTWFQLTRRPSLNRLPVDSPVSAPRYLSPRP